MSFFIVKKQRLTKYTKTYNLILDLQNCANAQMRWVLCIENNIIEKRSFDFAILIIKIYERLISDKKQFTLAKQLLRSGTSIGANVKEGLRGQSKKDFMAKMNIALKEANETEYWIKLLMETNYLDSREDFKLLNECREICKILNSIVKSTKATLN